MMKVAIKLGDYLSSIDNDMSLVTHLFAREKPKEKCQKEGGMT
jgi:hypothetical protein